MLFRDNAVAVDVDATDRDELREVIIDVAAAVKAVPVVGEIIGS